MMRAKSWAWIVMAGLFVAGCRDNPSSTLSPGGPAQDDAAAPRSGTVTDLSGDHNSHYDLAKVRAALETASSSGAITGISGFGGHNQVAVHSTVLENFPREGSSYLVVSAGDARNPTTTSSGTDSTVPCVSDSEFGTLCDVGGIDLSIALPANAQTLEFDLRYFTWDYNPYEDPFRVFVIAGSTVTRVAQYTLSSEIGTKSNTSFGLSPNTRHLAIDVSALKGQTITLRLQASDRSDRIYDGGALVDNLTITGNTAPVIDDINTNNDPASTDNRYAGDKTITFTAAATDADGDALTYNWTFTNLVVQGSTLTGTGPTTTQTFPSYSKYSVTLEVSDGNGGTDTETTTATVGHEVVITPHAPADAAGTGQVLVTAGRTDGTTGEYSVKQVTVETSATFYLSDGGWLFHARNLPDPGDPFEGFTLPIAPIPDGQRTITTDETRNWVGVLYDSNATNTSVPLIPSEYERLTVSPYTLSGGGRVDPYNLSLTFATGSSLTCTLRNESGQEVDVSGTENAFIILPHRDGATLPPLPSGAPGANLQRAVLLTAGTFASGVNDCGIAGIPTQALANAPVLETNSVTLSTGEQVQFITPFENVADPSLMLVAEPRRAFVDYAKDPWGDGKQDGDIGLVSLGFLADDANTLAVGIHVRGDSKYTLQVRYIDPADNTEQSIKVAVRWDGTKWEVVEKSLTPRVAADAVSISGYATGSGSGLEGSAIFRVRLPTGATGVELRAIAREDGLSDFAPNKDFKKVCSENCSYTWNTMD